MSKLDLRSFQQEIAERLAAARRATGEAPRLAFESAGRRFVLPLAEVAEVAPVGTLRALPGAQPWFLGVTNVRGSVIGLTHLGALLTHQAPEIVSSARILVLGGIYSRLRAGLLVDNVTGLRAVKSFEADAEQIVWASQRAIDAQGQSWSALSLDLFIQHTQFLTVEAAHATATRN